MKLSEILNYRINEKCYLIKDRKGNLIIVYGTQYRKVEVDDLYNAVNNRLCITLKEYLDGGGDWESVSRLIKHDLNDNPNSKMHWTYLDKKARDQQIDVVLLLVDGKKREL